MLEQIFLKVLDMSRTAGMIIVVVCIARIFLRRFPKCISYMLWSVVLFRLLCPATLELGISLVPSLEPVLYEYAAEKGEDPAEQTGKVALADTGSEAKESQGKAEEQERQESLDPDRPSPGSPCQRERPGPRSLPGRRCSSYMENMCGYPGQASCSCIFWYPLPESAAG